MTSTNPQPETVTLRDALESDVPVFFEQQLDPQANYLAAFTREDPSDEKAFREHWSRISQDSGIVIKTIVADGEIAGSVLCYPDEGRLEVSYWLGRPYWGRGIATRALEMFLAQSANASFRARVAKDNLGSLRVLQKCGFEIVGEDASYANGRKAVTEEWLLERPAVRRPA